MTDDFETAIHRVISRIPGGEVMSYGEVAEVAGFPGAARAVGNWLRTTPEEVPWWRIVGWDGSLRSPDTDEQTQRLRAEGVHISNLRATRMSRSWPGAQPYLPE